MTTSTNSTYYIDPNDPADLETLIQAPNPVFPASNFTYVVTVTNHGPDPAVDVTLALTPTSGNLGFFYANYPCSETGGVVNCSLGNLGNGASAEVLITMTVLPTVGSTEGNTILAQSTVTVASSTPEPGSPIYSNTDTASSIIAYNINPAVDGTNTPIADPRQRSGAASESGISPPAGDIVTNADGYSIYMGAGYIDVDSSGTFDTGEGFVTFSFVLESDPRVYSGNQPPLVSTVWLVLVFDPSVSDPVIGGGGVVNFDQTPVLVTGIDGKKTSFNDEIYTDNGYSETLRASSGIISPLWDISPELSGDPISGDTYDYRMTYTIPFSVFTDEGLDPTDPLKLFFGTSQNLNNINKDYTNLSAPGEPLFKPDIMVEKDDGVGLVQAGQTLTYEITVTNIGSGDATNVEVTDYFLPSNVTILDADGGTVSAGTVTWLIPYLAAGDSETFYLQVQVNDPLPVDVIQIVNNVEAYDDGENGQDPNLDNNTDDDIDDVGFPNLAITKSVTDSISGNGNGTAEPGEILTYTIVVENTGNGTAYGVAVSDTLPNNTGSLAQVSISQGSWNSSTGLWTVGNLAGGASATLVYMAVVNSTVPAGIETIYNQATAEADNHVPVSDDATISLNAAPDLSIDKEFLDYNDNDQSGNVSPGDDLIYRITVTNSGNQEDTGIIVTETMPNNTHGFVNDGNWSGSGPYTWTIASLAGGGASASASFTVTIDNPLPAGVESIENCASITGRSNCVGVPVIAAPDLSVIKTDGDTSVFPGQIYSYTITVTNQGNQGATGIVITDTLPAYTSFISASDSGNHSAGTVTWTINLAAGQSKNLTLTVQVDTSVPAGVEQTLNTVTVSHPDDENPVNNTATDTTPINAAPDIAVTKTDDGYEAEPGETYSYRIMVYNFGDQDATGVIVTDTLPAYLGFVGASDSGSYNAGTNTVTWTLDLAAGESETLILNVYVAVSVPAGLEEVINSVTATHPEDSNTGNNTATDTTPIIAAPDIAVTKTDGGISVVPGQTYSYTVTATNLGNEGATGVFVADTLPDDTTFVSASDSGSHGAGVVIWIIDLAAGESKDLTVTVQVAATVPAGIEELTNTARVYHPDDSDHSNDTGIDYTPVMAAPDIAVTKTDGGQIAEPGDVYGYMVTVTNIGNQGAAGTTVTDTLPAFVIFAGASDSGSEIVPGTVVWTIDLDAGESKDLFINFFVPATIPAGLEEVTNSATASHFEDTNTSNNTGSDTTPINAAPDIAVTKSDDGYMAEPGDIFSYVITVTNQGNQGATGITVTDTLPAYLSFISASDSGFYSAGTVTWTIDLIAGQTINLTVSVQVAASVPAGLEEVINSVTATHPEDSNTGNNTATDTTPINAAPDITVTKTDGGISVVPGQTYSYTITVTNQGNQGANSVFVIDVVPAYTNFVSASDGGYFDTGDVIWHINLAAGESKNLTMTVQVVATVPPGREETHNVATASHPEDTNTGNNSGYDTTPIIAAPDISVTKTDGDISVVPGQTYSYTITITNNGNQGAGGVTVTDTLPPYTTFVSADIGYSYDSGAGTVTWTIDLPAGMSTTRTVTVKVADTVPAGLEEVTNSVTASHSEDENPGNNTATDNTPINAAPDIMVIKSDGGYMAEPGDIYGYDIDVTNVGNQGATGVFVIDTLPAYTSFVSASDGGFYSAGTVTWTINLTAGQTKVLTIAVQVAATVPAGLEQVTNSATASHFEDTNTSNNTGTDNTPIIAAPELSVTKTDGGSSVSAGSEITYYITVENYGNQDATGVEILDTIPDYSTFVGPVGPQGWTDEGGGMAYSYKIGDLAAGASAAVQITIRLDSVLQAGVEEIDNEVKGRDDGENGSETTITDNSDQEYTPVIAAPDLVVTKTDNQTGVLPGQTLTYVITVRNAGNQGATGVELVEILPQFTTFIGPVTPDGWFYNPITDEYTYKIGNLAAGAEVTITFIVKVDDNLPLGITDIINLVTVSDDGQNGADMNLDDNWAEDEDRAEVTPPPVSPPLVSYPEPALTLTPRALPYTGFDLSTLLLLSLMLLGAGIISVFFFSRIPAAVWRRKR